MRTVTIWTITRDIDYDVFTETFGTEEQMAAALWAIVEEAADNSNLDLEALQPDDLVTDWGAEFVAPKEDDPKRDGWEEFIQAHGWKVRSLEVEAHEITVEGTQWTAVYGEYEVSEGERIRITAPRDEDHPAIEYDVRWDWASTQIRGLASPGVRGDRAFFTSRDLPLDHPHRVTAEDLAKEAAR